MFIFLQIIKIDFNPNIQVSEQHPELTERSNATSAPHPLLVSIKSDRKKERKRKEKKEERNKDRFWLA